MSNLKFRFALAVAALLALLIEAISGFFLRVVLPHYYIVGWQTWLTIHKYAAVALLALLAVHIWLHWRWLYSQVKALFKR
jgi:cytochrome b subunit of formate dehydrogenase